MQGKRATTSGTVKLVEFPQFMQKMRPYFVEKLGVHEAEAMVFRQQGDQMIFAFGGDQVVPRIRERRSS